MDIKIEQTHEKEIIALDDYTAVRLRPGIYVGNTSLSEDRVPCIIDGTIKLTSKKYSIGFMRMIEEILENSIDEAKRCKGKMKNIYITINLSTNEVTIKDEGQGFHNASKKHSKTKKNVVRTALEELHAGSNFSETDKNILGMNGLGVSICNILSEKFMIETINKTHYVKYEWNDFVVKQEEIRKKTLKEKPGTIISFIPSKSVFPCSYWDKDIISTYISFKSFLLKNDSIINRLKIHGNFIDTDKVIPIKIGGFIPAEYIKVSSRLGELYLWQSYEDSCSISFVNGSRCLGVHQRIVNDWCNEFFGYNLANHFYETLICLNVSSNLLRFGDQNKTKYDVTRQEIEKELESNFRLKLLRILDGSNIKRNIEKEIEKKMYDENISKIRKASKQSKRKISDKFSPSSKYKDTLYITEGSSAAGSIKQARNSEIESVYALRGKIKNAKKLSDLSNNTEILEMMSILEIEPNNDRQTPYEKIIIATDADEDGVGHITPLIINLFHMWFPHVIKCRKLYRLVTPLLGCEFNKEKRYFYSLDDYEKFITNKKVNNINYFKGLGSLSLDDWRFVMGNKILFQIIEDKNSDKFLNMAFGESSKKRKDWLEGKTIK